MHCCICTHVSCLLFRTFTVASEMGHGQASALDGMLYAHELRTISLEIYTKRLVGGVQPIADDLETLLSDLSQNQYN